MGGIAGIWAERRADARLAQEMIARLAGQRRVEMLAEGQVAIAQACGQGERALPLRLADWEADTGAEFPGTATGAGVVYDAAAQRLLLARDRYGTHSLFIARTLEGWAFASELKALLPALGAPAIEPRALAQYLQGRFSAGRHALFAGVERVQPGELLAIDERGEIERRRASTVSKLARTAPRRAATDFDVLAREVLPGYSGPDSVLACEGAESAQLLALLGAAGALPAATLGFAPDGDESSLKLARHYGIRHETIAAAGQDELARHLAPAVWAADDLIYDPAAPARLMLAEALGTQCAPGHAADAAWNGAGTLLTAAGAAEVFGSGPRYRRGTLQSWMDRWFAPETGGLRLDGVFQGMERALFGPGLHRGAPEWRAPYEAALASCPKGWDSVQRMQCMDLAVTLPERILASIDRACSAAGVAWRAPWLDPRMVEFGLALPGKLKDPGFLRARTQSLLPAGLGHAPLPALSARTWLQGETLERAGKVLASSLPLRAWLQKDALPGLVAAAHAGRPKASLRLALLLQFALWHRIFIETDGARPAPQDPLAFLE